MKLFAGVDYLEKNIYNFQIHLIRTYRGTIGHFHI